MIFAALQSAKTPNLWVFGLGSAVGLFAIALVVLFFERRYFLNVRDTPKETPSAAPRTENPAAFIAASMQGVIHKLRDQARDLKRRHRIERDRGEHSVRCTEKGTLTMPNGLLQCDA